MTLLKKSFNRYMLFYFAGGEHSALVQCFEEEEYRGRILFYPDERDMPPCGIFAGAPSLHYSLRQYQDVIDFIRYEKPLHLTLDPDSGKGYLATSNFEPIGEQEG